jgi:N-acyl-phosphatidylethanolamine-hydrolysing phospholipase D
MAAIYACSMTSPAALGAVPEDTDSKKHHLKNGNGFTNPWESWKDFSGPKLGAQMMW